MGLTNRSTGIGASGGVLMIQKHAPTDRVIALAGNPNVGKSTVFNALTGMHQHTGNWPGKTVTNAQGYYQTKNHAYVLVDIPGTYSLAAHSAEEEVARDFLCFGEPDAVVVVCDATCLERNMNLVLQTLEIAPRAVVCVNMMDEARRKHIRIDLQTIALRLGVPVIGISAQKKHTVPSIGVALDDLMKRGNLTPYQVTYCEEIEHAISLIAPHIPPHADRLSDRWIALNLLESDPSFRKKISTLFDEEGAALSVVVEEAHAYLAERGVSADALEDMIVTARVKAAADICRDTVVLERATYQSTDRRIDRWLTGRVTAYPVMLLLLAVIFWLTITGSNYPSSVLSTALFWVQDQLTALFAFCGAPDWLHGILVLGVYRTLAWVVSVMLPPMAIFFPLFTLLEDAGYLPRVAYNLDKPFKRCCACGKQGLTMCMGFGCNAAGVVGCRIIDSPRERLLAILTNSFVPCNGRFPTMVAMISMFLIGSAGGAWSSVLSALLLTAMIALGVCITFAVTKLLSKTLLKGIPSSFTLELPPYRKPQIGKVIVRSIFDRTLFVLGRAAAVAAPAGLVIWLMANITVGDASLLNICADFLDPFARLMGMDGVILMAFILGFPANEIVIPIILMAYMQQGSLLEADNLMQMKQLFVDNGWTWVTAVNVMLFSLLHWPCSTTLLTVKKETGSWKWTALAAALPTVVGVAVCMLFTLLAKWF